MYIFLFLTEPDVYMINHEREMFEGDLDIVVFHERFVESLVESNDVIGEGDNDDDKWEENISNFIQTNQLL